MEKINLKDLFETNKKDAENSDLLTKKNVVYSCKNLVNGKVYVGETNDTLYNR